MTDQEIVLKLIEKDPLVTQSYFFDRCKTLFRVIFDKVFSSDLKEHLDYDTLINDLYEFFMDQDAKKLRSFDYSCSLDGWFLRTTESYFLDIRYIQKITTENKKEQLDFYSNRCKKTVQSVFKNNFPQKSNTNYVEETNELYALVIPKLKTLKLKGSFDGWLYSTARNHFLKQAIKNSREVIGFDDIMDHINWGGEEINETLNDLERLLKYMTNETYADVLRKTIIEDMSPKELAIEMNKTLDNVYIIKSRAQKKLTRIALNDIKKYKIE